MQPLVINYSNYDPQINSLLSAPKDIILEVFDRIEDVQTFISFERTCKKIGVLFSETMPESMRAKKFEELYLKASAEDCYGRCIESSIETKIFLTRKENFKLPEEIRVQYFCFVTDITYIFGKDEEKSYKTEVNILSFLRKNANGAFEKKMAAYSDASPTNPAWDQLEAEISTRLLVQKSEISAKILELQKPNSNNLDELNRLQTDLRYVTAKLEPRGIDALITQKVKAQKHFFMHLCSDVPKGEEEKHHYTFCNSLTDGLFTSY